MNSAIAATLSRSLAAAARPATACPGPPTSSVFCANSAWPASCSDFDSPSSACELVIHCSNCACASASAARCSASACCSSTSARLASSSRRRRASSARRRASSIAAPRPPAAERPVGPVPVPVAPVPVPVCVLPVPVCVLPVPVCVAPTPVRSDGSRPSCSALRASVDMIIVDSDSSSASARPTAAVSSRLNSAALAKRSAGTLASAFRTTMSIASGMDGLWLEGGLGASISTFCMTATMPPENGRSPTRNWYRMTPAA